MHERKKMFADRSTAFIGLPGGYGTLEEVMEMTTWSQLGIHKKREAQDSFARLHLDRRD